MKNQKKWYKASYQRLLQLKNKETPQESSHTPSSAHRDDSVQVDNWEIEYEE